MLTNLFYFITGSGRKKECEPFLEEETRKFYHAFNFLEKICNLYEIESKDIGTKSYNILKYAFINGHCGLAKFPDGKFYVGTGTFSGELDADGFGKNYLITLQNGKTFYGEIGKNVTVLKWNNLALSRYPDLLFYASMLGKTDKSMEYNILYTRTCPIPIVENDLEQKSIEEVVSNLLSGKISIFKRASKRQLQDDNSQLKKDVLELTNPQASVYMQNLSRFSDEMTIRIMRELGVYVSERDKGAQLNDKELNAFKDYCAISSDDTYCMIKEWINESKKVFDIDITVKPKNFVYTNDDIANEEEFLQEDIQEDAQADAQEDVQEDGKEEDFSTSKKESEGNKNE